jgi:hypothetical protein
MPLVFIHGVRQRDEAALASLANQLREMVSTVPGLPENFAIKTPFWGQYSVKPRYSDLLPSLSQQEVYRSAEDSDDAGPLRDGSEAAPESQVKPETPEEGRDFIIDQLLGNEQAAIALIERHAGGALSDEEKAQIAALIRGDDVMRGETAEPDPSDAGPLRGEERRRTPLRDRNLSQSVLDALERAATSLALKQPGIQDWLRVVHNNSSLFLGDAMAYIMQRESSGAKSPILSTVLSEFPKERDPDDPLIVMTHSMGAVLCIDSLTTFRPDLYIDCLITIGSQVGQFQSLGLLAEKSPQLDDKQRVTGLAARIGAWWNVYCPHDFLNYLAGPAFADAQDVKYETVRGPFASHSWYFREANFYQRCAELISETLAKPRR